MYKKRHILKPLLGSLKKGTTIFSACKAVDIGVNTFWRWRMNIPRLDNLVNRIVEGRIQMVEDALFKNAVVNDNIAAQIFYLKNRGKDWKDTPFIDASRHTHLTFIKEALKKAENVDTHGRINQGVNAGIGE